MRRPHIISFDGPDNVGKTANIRWLSRAFPDAVNLGSAHTHFGQWKKITGSNLARWWFETSTSKQHVHTLFRAHRARMQKASGSHLYFVDRGPSMLAATCAATMALKDRIDPIKALETVNSWAVRFSTDQRMSLEILLLPSLSPEETSRFCLENESGRVSERYSRYQRLLAEVVLYQVKRNAYDHIVFVKDRPKVDIQNELRKLLSLYLDKDTPLLAEHIDCIWGIGGLSESGKSTVGETLRETVSACRLKIDYLVDLAATRLGSSKSALYATSDETLAELVLIELDRFARAHYYMREFSVESLHRFRMTRHLKAIMGDRFQVIYVDAPLDLRVKRSSNKRAIVLEKDRIKKARGVDAIEKMADWHIDNSGDLIGLRTAIATIVQSRSVWHHPVVTTPSKFTLPRAERRWLESFVKFTLTSIGKNLQLVALTGSASVGGWRKGWSDLDVLVVVDDFDGYRWRTIWKAMAVNRPATKVGLTILTSAEIEAGTIGAHIVHKLRLFAANELYALYCAPHFKLPMPRRAHDVRASLTDLPYAVGMLRRLILEDSHSVRQLYKSAVLVAKISLRVEGVNTESASDTLRTFSAHFCGGALSFPRPQKIESRDASARRRLTAACHRLLNTYDNWFCGLKKQARARLPEAP